MQLNRLIIIFLLLFATQQICGAAENNRRSPVVNAVLRVSPAVVNISSEYEVRTRANPFSGFTTDSFFDSFFKDFFEPGFERRYKRTSLGSGVIIDGKRGLILTNEHVIVKTGTITVVLKDKREFKAQIVGADPDSDLAVLRITSKTLLPAIEMGNSDDIMIGETIISIGNPFGFSHTVTTGVISALNRSVRTEGRIFQNFIQTDASINPGNSGGPLLNINGELIGINTAIYAKAQGIGFAIPINNAKRVVTDLIRYGEVIQAWVGITVQDLDARTAGYLNLPGNNGVLIKDVEHDSPAQKAGLQDGDILLALENRLLHSSQDYHMVLRDYSAGQSLKLRIWRNTREISISVKTAVFPLDRAMDLAHQLMGITVEDLSLQGHFRNRIVAKDGVVVSEIDRRSYLAHLGVLPGDVIRQIDEMTIKNTSDFKKAIVKYRKKASVVILLQREDQGYYITVKL
ncbi:MAG: Do family serine endopeptidase [Deltaproteobacteria bacterium]|nr:Do family serine endopeptidase [Deltaproteobacteria bacterium]